MRSPLKPEEIQALEHRVRTLLAGVKLTKGTLNGKMYLSHNDPYYCEAFGVVQCLDVLGLGGFSSAHKFNAREWLVDLVDKFVAEAVKAGSDTILGHGGGPIGV